jgi:hypothetical protein
VEPLHFPVVVGERTLVRRWVIPLLRKIRSNSTSVRRGLAKRPLNGTPLSVRTSVGSPQAPKPSTSAWHTARPVAWMTS